MADEPAPLGLAPGIILVAGATLVAFFVSGLTAWMGVGVTAVAVVIGVAVGNLSPPGPALRPGVAFVGKRALTLAVVLLGLGVTFGDLADTGAVALGSALGAVVVALVVAALVGRLLGVSSSLAALVGVGTGICGVSAIAAARPAVGARDEEVTYAVAAVTFLGSVGLLLYPFVQIGWHPLGPDLYGVLAGATLHSVPQAVGAAFAGGGEAAGTLATVTKLARVALLGPVVLALALWAHRSATGSTRLRLPVEVWGFLALFVAGSMVSVPDAVRDAVGVLTRVLLVAALAALGLMTRFSELRRSGLRPFVLAVVAWVSLVASGWLFLTRFA